MGDASGTFQLHPDNPRYFLYRGQPMVLITATEHYGAVINRAFDQIAYLDEAANRHMTLSRCFLLFRELEHFGLNPHSPCKPVPGHYLAPFARSGTDFATDGYPRFDLDEWDPAFFERLHTFLTEAERRGIIVELTLFSNTYSDEVWRLNPFNIHNNTNSVGAGAWQDYTSQRDAELFERQQTYVRKIVAEVNAYDNLYFEICNEPFGSFPNHTTTAEVDAWQAALRTTIHEVEARLPKRHLIFQVPVESVRSDGALDPLIAEPDIAAINLHDYQQLTYQGVALAPLARFMQRDLRLARINRLWTTCWKAGKPLVFDEDNAATNGLDQQAWTIHRKRAWTTICSGGHYDMIDFSIQAGGQERGTPAAGAAIRAWLGHLATFIHNLDFVHMQPLPDFCQPLPPTTVAATLARADTEYVVYLADGREIDEPNAGEPCISNITLALPPGDFTARLYSPVDGIYSRDILPVSANRTLTLPMFVDDIVIHIRAAGANGWDAVQHTSTTQGTTHSVAQNSVVEWTFSSTKLYDDPFDEVDLECIVTDPEGAEHVVPAFWAGDQNWRVRYASSSIGVHHYRTRCSDTTNLDLHGREGQIEITPYRGDNPLLQHGPLKVAADQRHLEHVDGTPFFWLGDTWWMSLCKRLRWPDDFQALIADRVAKGFSVVQIVAGLYPDMEPFDERGANEAGFPWTTDFTRINPAYFDMADRRLAALVDAGLVPCIVGCWGFFMDFAGPDVIHKHWRYLVARYAAYPVVWCVAGEALMLYYLQQPSAEEAEQKRAALRSAWGDLTRTIRALDPFHHPITIHPNRYGREQIDDPTQIDFEMLQTGHSGYPTLATTVTILRASLAKAPRMPVLVDEVNYEGIGESSREEHQRFLFWTALLMGAAGHTYGANGLWQVNAREAPYGRSPHGTAWGGPPWNEAAQLPGSGQLGRAKRLLERFRWWAFTSHPEWIEPHADEEHPMAPYAAGIPHEVRVFFISSEAVWSVWSGKTQLRELEPDQPYNIYYVDPKTGREYEQTPVIPNEDGSYVLPKPPIFQDWIIVLAAATTNDEHIVAAQ